MLASHSWRSRQLAVRLLVLVFLSLFAARSSTAQGFLGGPEQGNQYPPQAYYTALEIYRDGDLDNALNAFEVAMRSTRTDPNGKWIDAIPVHAMLAECYWHLGHMPLCRTHLDAGFQIAVVNRGWLGSIDWNGLIQGGAIAASPSNLWPEANAVRLAPLPSRLTISRGQFLTEQRLQQGGVIEAPNMIRVDAVEVMRSLAMMSFRRRVLLGRLSEQEALASEMMESTKYPPTISPAGRVLLGAMRGVGQLSVSEDQTVLDRVNKYSTLNGAVHPLTPLMLMAGMHVGCAGDGAGRLDANSINTLIATSQQAVNSAAALEQYECIGEALQLAVGAAGPTQSNRVEQTALLAARTLVRESRLASLHCYLVATDAALNAGRTAAAAESLGMATEIASRRDVDFPRLEAYGAYLAARLAAAQGESIGMGDGKLAAAMSSTNEFINNRRDRNRPVVSMPSHYQLGLVMGLMGQSMGNESAKNLLDHFTSPVSIATWRRDPLDAIAKIGLDTTSLHRLRLNLAVNSNDGMEVLQACDRVLAAKLTSALPLRGRLLDLRSLVCDPMDSFWPSTKIVVSEPPPLMAELRQQIQAMVQNQPADDVGARDLAVVTTMESRISQLALERIEFPAVNPPAVAEEDPRAMAAGVGLLTFLNDSNRMVATLTRDGKTQGWLVPGGRRIPALVSKLLAEIGANRSRGARLPDDEAWRDTATKIKEMLFPASVGFDEAGLETLVIVPDGALWYLPFDLLPMNGDDKNDAGGDADAGGAAPTTKPALWADAIQIAYAPTPGLALRDVGLASTADRLAIMPGVFFAPRQNELNEQMIEQMLAGAADPLRWTLASAPPTDRVGPGVGHLIVAAPITPNVNSPLQTSIMPSDSSGSRGDAAGPWDQLRGWLRLPPGGPKTLALPGYRTAAAAAKLGQGDEVFFPLVALRASGVREVLLSRWATGGQSAATVIGELVNETPHTSLGDASRRAISLLRQTELSVAGEPLLGKADEESQDITGDQPLFWSSYLTTGSFGLSPPKSDQ